MKQKIIETIKKYNLINSGDKIVLGVSGGPDSIAMLDILNQLKDEMNFEIYVVHVNHNIRGKDADEDEEYVKKYCEKYNIKCFSKKIDVPTIAKTKKIGTEEAGRKVRYEYFEEILKETKSNKIAIAHNKNDKVETIIMHLLRGSGISGLRGIEPIREEKFIKPLIECDRQEIENYCKENNLQPRIDKTNFENEYTRNKIRNIVIPYIKKEFNPNIIETITRLADVVSSEDDFIENVSNENYKKVDSLAICAEYSNLVRGMELFYRGKSNLPKFKGRNDKHSYTTSQVNNNIRIVNNKIRLPKVGFIKVRGMREIPSNFKIKRAIIFEDKKGKFFISIVCEITSH